MVIKSFNVTEMSNMANGIEDNMIYKNTGGASDDSINTINIDSD